MSCPVAPMRGRELKHGVQWSLYVLPCCPYAGARIETTTRIYIFVVQRRCPYAGARIETPLADLMKLSLNPVPTAVWIQPGLLPPVPILWLGY